MANETADSSASVLDEQLRLALELSEAHRAIHAKLGAPHQEYLPMDGEYYRLGDKGVIGVFGEFVHTYIPADDKLKSTRDAIKLYKKLLDKGQKIVLPVYYLNWPSIMAIKRLGSTLIGVDEDSFLHYELTSVTARFKIERTKYHGQEGSKTTES